MSKFLNPKYEALDPYTPGEQPRDKRYIKLNTNESPFPPSPRAIEYAKRESEVLELYSDPTIKFLTLKMAEYYGVGRENIIMTNGSDEVLNFAFMAFTSDKTPALFSDITYGFYSVFASLHGIKSKIIPLREDFTISVDDYINENGTVFIANPNAPTGILLPLSEIERLVSANPERVVVIDEAYIDFGGESAVGLTRKYKNLLVTGTFSKSRSMAGARLGFGIASEELISDLERLRNSTNPYNVNRMTMAAGIGSLEDDEYFKKNCLEVIRVREKCSSELTKIGFEVLPSMANFIFLRHKKIGGEELYLKLKENGILVRHFAKERISEYNRVSIGSESDMQTLIDKIKKIWSNVI